MRKDASKKGYVAPALTEYGSVETITGNQSSSGSDVPLGPGTIGTNPGTYYSVGK